MSVDTWWRRIALTVLVGQPACPRDRVAPPRMIKAWSAATSCDSAHDTKVSLVRRRMALPIRACLQEAARASAARMRRFSWQMLTARLQDHGRPSARGLTNPQAAPIPFCSTSMRVRVARTLPIFGKMFSHAKWWASASKLLIASSANTSLKPKS